MEEVNEAVAIVKRIKELLILEKAKFESYLILLEKEDEALSKQKIDLVTLDEYTKLGNEIVASVANLQKVAIPFFKLYESFYFSENHVGSTSSRAMIALLQNDLYMLKTRVLEQNRKNREKLQRKLQVAGAQIDGFKNPYNGVSSVYSKKQAEAQFIEVTG